MILLIGLMTFTAVAVVLGLVLSATGERAEMRAALRSIGHYEIDNVREQELLLPVTERVVGPIREAVASFGRRFLPVGYMETAQRKLVRAGRPTADDFDRWRGIRVLTLVLLPIAFVLVWVVAPVEGSLQLVLLVATVAILLLGPDARLNREVAERRWTIQKQLPDILDLLTISVEAGLGFEQALDRTTSAVPGALSEEFRRMLGEVRAGAGRADALRSMQERVDIPEIRSFVLALLQADTFGVSIGRVLRVQAEEMRVRRRQLAQEEAQKAPVKLLIPMVLCIFPSLFVVVLAPAIINIQANL